MKWLSYISGAWQVVALSLGYLFTHWLRHPSRSRKDREAFPNGGPSERGEETSPPSDHASEDGRLFELASQRLAYLERLEFDAKLELPSARSILRRKLLLQLLANKYEEGFAFENKEELLKIYKDVGVSLDALIRPDVKPLDLNTLLLEQDLTPQAILDEDVSVLAQRASSQIVHGVDDLDEFEGTAFSLRGIPIALMRHKGHPDHTVTVYLPFSFRDLRAITEIIAVILPALSLTPSQLRWQRADNPDL